MVFSKPDGEFQKSFEEMLKTAYSGLFDLHSDDAWTLPLGKLQSYFRSTDQTSEIVGRNQAITFVTLASLAGHGDTTPPATRPPTRQKAPRSAAVVRNESPSSDTNKSQAAAQTNRDFGLTVRIEVNLPPQGDQDTYDKIFRSIRENLFPNAK